MFNHPKRFYIIADNTIAVMLSNPQKKENWLHEVKQMELQARIQNDAQMISLLDSVELILEGHPLNTLKPRLSGVYAECWLSIVNKLTSVPADSVSNLFLGRDSANNSYY